MSGAIPPHTQYTFMAWCSVIIGKLVRLIKMYLNDTVNGLKQGNAL
jgi:hypothetical protein